MGAQLLAIPSILAAVQEGQQRQLDLAELTALSTLRAIQDQVCGDIRCLFDASGNLKPIKDLSRAEAALIAGFEVVIKNAAAGDGHTDTIHKVKLKDQARYVEMAAKHFALLTDVVDIRGIDGLVSRLQGARSRKG
jgi:phage terminase small subunit